MGMTEIILLSGWILLMTVGVAVVIRVARRQGPDPPDASGPDSPP